MNYFPTIATFVVALTYPAQVRAFDLIPLSAHTSIDTFRTLSIDQLWNSTPPKLTRGTNAVIEIRQFDAESRPRFDKWIGCGWLLIGTGDIGIKPVGFNVWTDKRCDYLTLKRAESIKEGGEIFYLDIGAGESHRISIDQTFRVFIEKREIGIIRE